MLQLIVTKSYSQSLIENWSELALGVGVLSQGAGMEAEQMLLHETV